MKNSFRLAVLVFVAVSYPSVSQTARAQAPQVPTPAVPMSEAEQRATAALESAGFFVDGGALIIALNDSNGVVVSSAVRLAPRFAGNPAVVSAVRALVDGAEPNSRLAVDAIAALQSMGEVGWEAAARVRMQRTRARIDRLHLAVVFAKARSAEGWPLVRQALLDRDFFFALEGLINVDHFDGLADVGGQRIDIAVELASMREQVLPELQPYLDIAVKRVTNSRSR
jgi:hypothetical protein